jgi:hypothetical protein
LDDAAHSRIKIGYSIRPFRRAAKIGRGQLIGLIRGGRELEKELHNKFARFYLHNEWFSRHTKIFLYIKNENADSLLQEMRGVREELFAATIIDSRIYAELKALAIAQDRSVAYIIRKAIELYLSQEKT